MTVPADILAILQRAAAGDADAQNELATACYPRVQQTVHRELSQDFRKRHRWMLAVFSTGDIVQDVLHGVIRSLDAKTAADFADPDALTGYLATIVRHRLTDTVRHYEAQKRDTRRNEGHIEIADARGALKSPEDTPPASAALLEQVRIIADTIDQFAPRERALLQLRLVDELQFEDVATKLGFGSAKSARAAFLKAHAKLLIELRERGVRDSMG